MVSPAHCSLKAASLKTAPTMGTVDRTYLPRTGKVVRSLGWPKSSSWVNQWPRPFSDLLQQMDSEGLHALFTEASPSNNSDVSSGLGCIQVLFPCEEHWPKCLLSVWPCVLVTSNVLEDSMVVFLPLELTWVHLFPFHCLTPAPSPAFPRLSSPLHPSPAFP